LLVCESSDGDVFGAFLGFQVRPGNGRAYGNGDSFLFNLGGGAESTNFVYRNPDPTSTPLRTSKDSLEIGLGEDEIALGLDDLLQTATCQPSKWCGGVAIGERVTKLRSVILFSHIDADGRPPGSTHSMRAYHLIDSGEAESIITNEDALIMGFNPARNLRDHFG